jgi:hypothetical protein
LWLRLIVDAQSGLAVSASSGAPFEVVRRAAASPV